MTTDTPAVRVLKTGTCPTLSGRGQLTYEVGTDDAANVAIRLVANSGGGFFNEQWVPIAAITKILQSPHVQKGLTSTTLIPIYRGKSANSPAFLTAVLKAEGAIRLQEGKTRAYEVADLDSFLASVSSDTKGIPAKASGPREKAGPGGRKAIAVKKTKA